ncbi:MAG: polyprenyl synthetase family protein [Anaerolineae bacterium]|nr:polyprenyl synthetase family protein [Anaerolineae bacterium]
MVRETYEVLFGGILADIETELRAVRAEQQPVAPLLWEIIDYQFGWDADTQAAGKNVTGKRIRPVLMALVAQAVCGDYAHVLPAGTALEIIHNFTLIHDDVMDQSQTRRHHPAVWTRWGTTQAINAGDGLFALSNLTMARLLQHDIPAAKVVEAGCALSQATLWTCEGQILDIGFETRTTVSPDEYITMISHKTGTLIEAAAYIGALLSTDDDAVITGYKTFARHLGVAFQVRDDYLDVWGDKTKLGKPGTDIREKKKAYPFLVTLERAAENDRATLHQIYAQDTVSDADVQTVLAIMARVNAAEQTDKVTAHYYDLALQQLESTGIQNEWQDQIRQMAGFLIRRAS